LDAASIVQIPDQREPVVMIGIMAVGRDGDVIPAVRGEWIQRVWQVLRVSAPDWVGRQVSWDVLIFVAPGSDIQTTTQRVSNALRECSSLLVMSRAAIRRVSNAEDRLEQLDHLLGVLSAAHNFEASVPHDLVRLLDGTPFSI
jgi:hypothetical protein